MTLLVTLKLCDEICWRGEGNCFCGCCMKEFAYGANVFYFVFCKISNMGATICNPYGEAAPLQFDEYLANLMSGGVVMGDKLILDQAFAWP
jgi:hypothetical protein